MSLLYSLVSYNYVILVAYLSFSSTQSQLIINTSPIKPCTDPTLIVIPGESSICYPNNNTVVSCPRQVRIRDDYQYVESLGSAYKFHTGHVHWNKARRICIEEGAHLAVINSRAEAQYLKSMLHKGSVEFAYIGIHDLYAEGHWVTIFDQSVAHSGFDTWSTMWGGQPDNFDGVENCGVLLYDGTLNDIQCYLPHHFFCEKVLTGNHELVESRAKVVD